MNIYNQAEAIYDRLEGSNPSTLTKHISNIDCGSHFVLLLLSDSTQEVYASTISEQMKISRARIGVMLDKMYKKGLITKTPSRHDARIDVLKITKLGLKELENFKQIRIQWIIKVIEKIGYNNFIQFLDTAKEIKNILSDIN